MDETIKSKGKTYSTSRPFQRSDIGKKIKNRRREDRKRKERIGKIKNWGGEEKRGEGRRGEETISTRESFLYVYQCPEETAKIQLE